MKAFAAVVTLALLAAGCAGPAEDRINDGALEEPVWGFADAVFVGAGADVEAAVHVTSDGTILTCSHGGFHKPSPLWVSEDGGVSFSELDPQPNPIVSGDCDLASNADGAWAIVYDTIASATIAVTHDRGQTWAINYLSALPIAVDRPWITWHEDELYMTYANVMSAEPAIHMFARSTDDGRTWIDHTPITLAEPPGKVQALIGKMVVDGDTIRVPLARGNLLLGGPLGIDHAVSFDGGRTWGMESLVAPFDTAGFFLPALTIANGTWYETIALPVEQGHDIGLLASKDGKVWSEPVIVARNVTFPGVVGPWVDGRADGSVSLAWIEHVEGGWTASSMRVEANGALHGPVHLAVPVDIPQGIGHEFISLDHTPDGRAVVAWPMNTGPACDPAPNAAESRGSQCMYLAIEQARLTS